MENEVKVNPDELTEADYDAGCRILSEAIPAFFAQPGVREEYLEWLKTEEGQLAGLPLKERQKRLKAKQKHSST